MMQPVLTQESLVKALTTRYATKQFDSTKKLTNDQVDTLLSAAHYSPSWYGTQPWKFVVVESTDLRAKLRAVSYDQPQVTESSHFVVFTYKTAYNEHDVDEYVAKTATLQHVAVEDLKGLKDGIMGSIVGRSPDALATFAANQTHIALGFLLEAAALLGIDACPMGGFDPNAYDDILGLKEQGLHAVVIVALGYRKDDDPAAIRTKSRFDLEEVVLRK